MRQHFRPATALALVVSAGLASVVQAQAATDSVERVFVR
jgi:hypothetical protein